jgi:hypothetical protein
MKTLKNNKGQGQMLIILLVGAFLFGGIGGAKISGLNPFKGNKAQKQSVQKAEESKEEYFKDKIKGIEYRAKESSKSQNKEAVGVANATIGQRVGDIIDSSLRLIITFIVVGFLILFFTGFNIFKKVRALAKKANTYRKGLKQTVKAIAKAKGTMNGEYSKLAVELKDTHDDETEGIVKEMKNE